MPSGITIVQQPASNTFLPAYNPIIHTATSSNTAQPNFQFYVTVTIYYKLGTSYTTQVYNYPINTPPDSILRFDVAPDLQEFIKNPITFNTTGWSRCPNGLLKVTVNIGEKYGATPAVTVGTDRTYYVWNSVEKYLNFPTYSTTNYVCVNGSTFPILNSYPYTSLNPTSANWLYLLANTDSTISKATVRSSDGFINYSFDIVNPYYASGNWYDRYVALNISPYSLEVLGTVNFNPAEGTTIYIDLYDTTPTLRKTVSFTYTDICSKNYAWNLIYLNDAGAWDTFPFEMVSDHSSDIQRTTVSHSPYLDEAATGLQVYTAYDATEFVMSTTYKEGLLLRSNIITADQSLKLQQLINSPTAYLQSLETASPTTLWPINVKETKYSIKYNFNEKLPRLEVNVGYAHTNMRQRGL